MQILRAFFLGRHYRKGVEALLLSCQRRLLDMTDQELLELHEAARVFTRLIEHVLQNKPPSPPKRSNGALLLK